MQQYQSYLNDILTNGEIKGDRTGTGTISLFGTQMKFDLKKRFPLVTIKKMPLRIIFEELMWFIRGQTNIRHLVLKNVDIWNDDTYRHYKEKVDSEPLSKEAFIERIKNDEQFAEMYGDLGPIYGKQWRAWESPDGAIDQLAMVIHDLKSNPDSRRHIISGWNVGVLAQMGLPPCHNMYQFYRNSRGLSCMVNLRSSDGFLGAAFNIASAALLTHFIALEVGIEVDTLIFSIGDAHIYLNHIDQVKTLLSRTPKDLPTIKINKRANIEDYEWADIELINYNPHPAIKGALST